jgi:ubiquinone/menaquinone biosynthesis C-methylase UbiE
MVGRMNSTPDSGLPDYNRLAADFDRYLPLIEPVAQVILEHLPTLPQGAQVLDVACGTGEPSLTLNQRAPGARVLGVDVAKGMIEVARAKAQRKKLPTYVSR